MINPEITRILVYTNNTCPHCQNQKDWMLEKGIPFQEKSVQDQVVARELQTLTHQLGIPVTVIEYNNRESEYILTFNRDLLEKTIFIQS